MWPGGPTDHLLIGEAGERVAARPAGLRYADLWHHFARLLISGGHSVQARMRHAWAVTTLDLYGHIPDGDEATRATVEAAPVARADSTHTKELTV